MLYYEYLLNLDSAEKYITIKSEFLPVFFFGEVPTQSGNIRT